MVNLLRSIDAKSHTPSGFGRKRRPAPPTHYDGYPQPSCWYQLPVRSERGSLSLQMSNWIDRTYVEDMKDPNKVLPPSCNLVLITFREYESEEHVPFALLNDVPLNLRHGSAIGTLVSGGSAVGVCVTGLTHPVRSPMLSRTAWVSSSSCLPFNLRWRTWHTSPQARPSST